MGRHLEAGRESENLPVFSSNFVWMCSRGLEHKKIIRHILCADIIYFNVIGGYKPPFL
jgi:hypothetical protein